MKYCGIELDVELTAAEIAKVKESQQMMEALREEGIALTPGMISIEPLRLEALQLKVVSPARQPVARINYREMLSRYAKSAVILQTSAEIKP